MVSDQLIVFDNLRQVYADLPRRPSEPNAYFNAQKALNGLVSWLRESAHEHLCPHPVSISGSRISSQDFNRIALSKPSSRSKIMSWLATSCKQ